MSPLLRRTAALVAVLSLSACSGGGSPTAASSDASGTAVPSTAASTAPPPPVAPRVGSCHALSLDAATSPVDTRAAVPCTRAHTSVTVEVGRLAPLLDGHLLAVDSRTVRARVQRSCPPGAISYAGGDLRTRRLSRLQVVWFTPSLEQADAGADWFRCDLVALAAEGRLDRLPARMKGALDAADALDRFGTCGTAAPGRPGFRRVVCSRRHSWRAVDTVELGARTRYLAKPAAARADAACKRLAAARAKGALTYAYSFEWPTRLQWAAGQRYGYCWLPTP